MSHIEYDECPYCKGRYPVKFWMEHHPYGEGTAAEQCAEQMPCLDCGFGGEDWEADKGEAE